MKRLFKYFWMGIFLLACTEDEFVAVDPGHQYQPLRTRLYWIYNIDSTGYAPFVAPRRATYQIKQHVTDSFPNADGTFTFVIKRSIRTSATTPWKNLNTWSARFTDQELVVTEGTSSFVKLRFPVQLGSPWNGNRFNNRGKDDYEITEQSVARDVNGVEFNDCIQVEQEFNDDIIVFQDIRYEVYARNVGMIKKEVVQLNYCTADQCLGQQRIESGMLYKQELVSYGIE